MTRKQFEAACIVIAVAFTVAFAVLVVPALLKDGDIIGAFAAGFVNPHSSGYSTDVILCWVTLAVWVVYDAKANNIKHGWLCLLLGALPGVAVGFPLYLLTRSRQLAQRNA